MEVLLGYWFRLAQWFTETFGTAPYVIKISWAPGLTLAALALLSFSLFKISGYSFTGIALTFTFSLFPPTRSRVLGIPNHEDQPKADEAEDLLSLLTWRARLSDFSGRNAEMDRLKAWAKKPTKGADILFVSGPGGSGKTRLAAQFGRYLKKKGWNAGFLPEAVSLEKLAKPRWGRQGVLLILDYPENDTAGVVAMMEQLADDSSSQRLRVLFLTRSSRSVWSTHLQNSRASSLVREKGIELHGISHEAGHAIFSSTVKAATAKGATPRIPSVQALGAWMDQDREINCLPLFLVAAAVYSATNQDKDVLGFSGPDIIKALTDRERGRLQNMAEGNGLPLDALALALTYATLCKGVPLAELEQDASLLHLLGLQGGVDWQALLSQSCHAARGTLRNLEPDIVGADFVHATLGRNKKQAPELVWRAAARNPMAAIGTFGRLIYDAQSTLGRPMPHVHDWLLMALESDRTRCGSLTPWPQSMRLPTSLCVCSVFVSKHALTDQTDDAHRAEWLNNMSVDLSALGKDREAFVASQEARDIFRRLAVAEPARFEPGLAASLNNLARCLSDMGHLPKALEASQEAVTIYRSLAAQEPTSFLSHLAASLNNLSTILSCLGQQREALRVSQEVVTIRRRQAAQESATFEHFLAASLNNLSGILSASGQSRETVEAIHEAVIIYRRLAAQDPACFEPYLALSLNNLSQQLSAVGQHGEALEASQESVTIRRRFAAQEPRVFEPVLVKSLYRLAELLIVLNRHDEATAALAEVEDIERRLEEAQRAETPEG